MRLVPSTLALALVLALAHSAPVPAHAHGDLHDQIAQLTKQMASVPEGSVKLAVLHLQRGELHRMHGEFEEAEADLLRAAAFDPDRKEEKLRDLDLALGRLYLDWDKHAQAKLALDRYVAKHADDPQGLITLSHALVQLGWGIEAVDHLDRAIAKHPQPEPDHYLGRAAILEDLGAKHLPRAVRGLDDGIRRLGPVVTLQTAAIDLELQQKRWDAALRRVGVLAKSQPRKDIWFAKRAEILELAGRRAKALSARRAALAAHDKLPPTIREQTQSVELRKQLIAGLP